MKNNICGIYYIKNTSNNNMYIGQSVNIKARFCSHKCALKKNKHYNEKLQEDFNKYGMESFEFGVLEECESESLDELEQYYIKKYNTVESGYNNASGGLKGFKSSEETKLKVSLNHADVSGKNNPAYGKTIKERMGDNYDTWLKNVSEANKRFIGNQNWKLVKNRPMKPCILYDVYGIKIKEYKKATDCAKEFGFKYTPIGKWIKEEYYLGDESRPFHWNLKTQTYLFNNIVFKSTQELTDYLGIKTRKSISMYLSGKRKVPKRYEGMRACVLEDIPLIESGIIKKYNKETDHFDRRFDKDKSGHYCKRVVQLNLDGSFVKEFDSIKDASESMNVRDSTILRVCQGKSKTSCGFLWKYKEEYDKENNNELRTD
jgi:group I intron endonuclease